MSTIDQTGINRTSGIQFKATARQASAAEIAATGSPDDVNDVNLHGASSSSHIVGKSLLTVAGAGLMAALSLAGGAGQAFAATAPTAQVQLMAAPAAATDTSDSARTGNANPAALSDAQAGQILNGMPGLKDGSALGNVGNVISGWFGHKFDGPAAVKLLDQGKDVQVDHPGGGTDDIKSKDQLAELAVMEGKYANSGVSDGIVRSFQTVEKSGGFAADGHGMSAYQAFDNLRHGHSVSANVGGQWYALSTPGQVQELNALEGNGQDNPLAPATSNLLKKMSEGTQGEGLFQNGTKLNAYQYLQAAEGNQGGVTYNFNGGPYNDPMSVPVAHFGDLGTAAQTAANQHAADAVRPSFSFFSKQMTGLTGQMQSGVKADLQRAQQLIDGGTHDVASYTAAAQAEAQAIPGAQQAVSALQARLNNAMPRYNVASQRLQDAKAVLQQAQFAAGAASGQEASALQANQDAQAQLDNAQARLQRAESNLSSQPPADPFASNSSTSSSSSTPPADPWATPAAPQAGSAPADPFANNGQSTAPSDNGAAAAAAQAAANRQAAVNEEHNAKANVANAKDEVNATYNAWAQAHNVAIGANNNLGVAQGNYNGALGEYQTADGIRAAAASDLQAAQQNLSNHQSGQANDLAAVQQAKAQIEQGKAALATAQNLEATATKYQASLGDVKDMGGLDAQRQALSATVHQMAGSAVNSGLQQSLKLQGVLLNDMGKPMPPAGYHEATPLVTSEQ